MTGRPRIHPEGTTNAERKRISRAARATGQVSLPGETMDALAAIREVTGERFPADVVRRLVEAEAGKIAGT